MQRAIEAIYPNQCAYCDATVDEMGGLCADCWRETRFAIGHTCDLCAVPLPGQSDGVADHCDDCLRIGRPWSHGRAAIYYEGVGRNLALALKYSDRTDLAKPAARWMARAATDILTRDTVLVPVPAHWRRLLSRKYNPAVELAKALGAVTGLDVRHEALLRTRATPPQEGLGFTERFQNVDGAISFNPKTVPSLAGRQVCVVDDTMTSGATLAAACDAVHRAGAGSVTVVVLAKTVKASYL